MTSENEYCEPTDTESDYEHANPVGVLYSVNVAVTPEITKFLDKVRKMAESSYGAKAYDYIPNFLLVHGQNTIHLFDSPHAITARAIYDNNELMSIKRLIKRVPGAIHFRKNKHKTNTS